MLSEDEQNFKERSGLKAMLFGKQQERVDLLQAPRLALLLLCADNKEVLVKSEELVRQVDLNCAAGPGF